MPKTIPLQTTALDLSILLRNVPDSHWVALSKDQTKVIMTGIDLNEVVAGARRKGENDVVVTKPMRGTFL